MKAMKRKNRAGKPADIPPPPAPPQLTAMASRKERLEAERADLFAACQAALKETDGNVSKAAMKLEITRDRANQLTRRLGLVEYAASLRVAATGHSRGRQDR